MAKAQGVLTPLGIRKMTGKGLYRDSDNLYLQITKEGVKSWLFRGMLKGKVFSMGLGPAGTYTLPEARELAREARKLLLQGINPLEQKRKSASASATFDKCAEDYITIHRHGWKNPKHGEQWVNTLNTYASPIFGNLPVSEIDTDLVMKVLLPIWTEKTETASRVRGRIESVLGWATTSKFRTGENPARWKGHLENLLPAAGKVRKVKNHPALPYQQAGAFMAELRKRDGTSARALEFAILTACRSGEVRGATWGEIDLKAKHWTIPASRMKAEKEHRVPLSDAAVKLLEALPRMEGTDLAFPAPRGGDLSDMALTALIRRMSKWTDAAGAPITAHGFRSTFRDWAGETTAHPREVIEHALAHQLKDKAEAAYQRGSLFDKRIRLMTDWAAYCAKVQAEQPANVVEIRGAA